MKIKAIFNISGITREVDRSKTDQNLLNDENINFMEKIKDIYSTDVIVINCHHDSNHFKSNYNFSNIIAFENEKEANLYIEKEAKNYDWILFFSNSKILTFHSPSVIQLPIDFYGHLSMFDSISFTEHAKNKLLYNELSKYYMEAIANNTEKEVSFLEDIFKNYVKKTSGKILDCCCGIGRHDLLLGQDGYGVTGIDICKSQIENAQKIHSHKNINYVVGDVRNFNLDEKYNMCICMWTTYNYLSQTEDLKKFLFNVYNHLEDDGILVLDSKNIPALEKRRIYKRNKGNNRVSLELLVYKRIIDNIQNSQYFYFINDDGKKNFYFDEEFVRFYYLNELKEICKPYFELVDSYGDFDKEEYRENSSNRFIAILKKNTKVK